MFSEYLNYTALACSALFLLGAIKLSKEKNTPARRLLVFAFAIIMLCSIFSLARYLEVIEISYTPFQRYYNPYSDPVPILDKIIYWGNTVLSSIGGILGILGFFMEARDQNRQQRETYHQSTA